MAAPVLDLDTLIHRETVRIDGVRYELRSDKELTIFDLTKLDRAAARIQHYEREEEPTADQQEEYRRLLDRSVRLVLIAPDEVHARLNTAHREAILWTFIGLSRPSLAPTRATAETPPTTARAKTRSRSARGSRASTAARRKSG